MECVRSGTTAVALVMRGTELTLACCGDSRAVLATGGEAGGASVTDH